MSNTIYAVINETFEQETCCSCGVRFYMTSGFRARRLADGESFYCPSGHKQYYTESIDKKNQRLAEEKQRLQNQVNFERDQRLAAELATAKLKKRIGRGVCPCCHRTVKQLAAHIKTKHPDYGK